MKISVVIPCYNGEKFIRSAINSINNQTLQPFEIVVVNDGSKDDSLTVLNECEKVSKVPLKIIDQENGGVSSARNVGIAAAEGNWIAFLDVDDLWYPNKLSLQASIISKCSEKVGLICTDYHIDSKEDINSKYNNSRLVSKLVDREVEGEEFQLNFIEENFIGTASVMLFNKKLAQKIGCFDIKFNHSEDFDFILRFSQYASVYMKNEPLVLKQHHGDNLTDDLALYYHSHAISLRKNIDSTGNYFRSNFSSQVIKSMKLSHDKFLKEYSNILFERKQLLGIKSYLFGMFKVYTFEGWRINILGLAGKLLRMLSLNLIKRK
ncbi:glycosyltransferase family 2 protein [Pseudoalteromonas sp. AS71]|uniref:glycosyltransferase family 2 protein n=1 Tax=Pseudoalteromonas sp. AS71 TaxID=3135777 RepID=UPI0031706856